MDWFERLTGFREDGYQATRDRLRVEDGVLHSLVNGRRYGVGVLEFASLGDLRRRASATSRGTRGLRVGNLTGDVGALHCEPAYAGALFQVASQFNLLEMAAPRLTPEDGVAVYASDPTQGPACAIAAGAATIYRNYFVPVDGVPGQTRDRQLDGLAGIGAALGAELGVAPDILWTMQNGYALCTKSGLARIAAHLDGLDEAARDRLRAKLRIGFHRDVEVTRQDAPPAQRVSQAFCSAMPVAYCRYERALWQPLARLVLEAAYEATLCAGLINARAGGSRRVVLTRLGGGAFGNDDAWIDAAMRRALHIARNADLDVVILSWGGPPRSMIDLAAEFG